MVRLILRESDVLDAVNAQGPVIITYKTFDVDLPEVEEWLRSSNGYKRRELIAAESLPAGDAHVG